jgi:putative CocE/NonD family hydrolase
MYGFSYQGLTQLLAAAEAPAALQCIAPAQTAGDLFSGWFYHQGAYRLASSVGWALQLLRGDARKRRLKAASRHLEEAATRFPSLLAAAPYSRIGELTARGLPTYHRDWTTHRAAGPWWARHDVSTRMDRIRIPCLHLWGWFDTYLDGSEQLYQCLRAESKAPQYLVAGPWNHIPWSRYCGEADHGPDAILDTDRLLLRWFNHWLKDSGDFEGEPLVRSFALGENRWHTLSSWPHRSGSTCAVQRWFLDSDGRANSIQGDGRLGPEPPSGMRPRDGFVYEPEVPAAAPGLHQPGSHRGRARRRTAPGVPACHESDRLGGPGGQIGPSAPGWTLVQRLPGHRSGVLALRCPGAGAGPGAVLGVRPRTHALRLRARRTPALSRQW